MQVSLRNVAKDDKQDREANKARGENQVSAIPAAENFTAMNFTLLPDPRKPSLALPCGPSKGSDRQT